MERKIRVQVAVEPVLLAWATTQRERFGKDTATALRELMWRGIATLPSEELEHAHDKLAEGGSHGR